MIVTEVGKYQSILIAASKQKWVIAATNIGMSSIKAEAEKVAAVTAEHQIKFIELVLCGRT